MTELMSSGFNEFERLAVLYRRTRDLLDVLSATGELPGGGSEVLATQTLPHVEDMEAGFRIRLRATEADLDELRALLAHAGLLLRDPRNPAEKRAALIETIQALSGAGGARQIVPPQGRRLAAIDLARLVFALVPQTAAEDVHYPAGLRSYADIFAPRTPGQLAERIEELERSLWRIATGETPRLSDGGYRRTYGFFDTAARVAGSGSLLA
jgi:hypothetical protein